MSVPLVAKLATDPGAFRRPVLRYGSARAAFRALLAALQLAPGERVLLPAFIGWSAREGSGVFDPVRELDVAYDFYRVDERLRIDLADLEQRLARGGVRVVVLIHYFGYPDPRAAEANALARRHGAFVLEDEAHAMLTDLVGGAAGREGDAAIFSLHKLLPSDGGGMLLLNSPAARALHADLAAHETREGLGASPWDFDLRGIAEARRANAETLQRLLAPLGDEIEPLWPELPAGVAPQTLPVLVRHASRDQLYFAMNERGFGVVSLYHTLIDAVKRDEFPDAHATARRILNLPVHQDTRPDALSHLVTALSEELARASAAGPA